LRRGIECAPGDIELYRALAEHEINRGRIDSVSPPTPPLHRIITMIAVIVHIMFRGVRPDIFLSFRFVVCPKARELLEKGIEMNPLYAPLYHSLAELEARVFNIEGLAKLNKRTSEIFPSNAMATPSFSTTRMEAWGNKIKQGRWAKIPDGIAALAEKIGVDNDTNIGEFLDDVDPESLVNSMGVFGDDNDDGFMFR
jgi:hypothetical protein